MATPRQIDANRQNALKSTGPQTEKGKQIVRANALKHGLAGHGVVFPDELADALETRKQEWREEMRPEGPYQEWLFEQICIESTRADACLHQEIARRDELAQRAAESWDEDRALLAERLAEGLARRPEIVQKQLLQTLQGADLLIREWEIVGASLRNDQEWSADLWNRALDLLGVPVDRRQHRSPAELGPGTACEPGLRLIDEQVSALQRRRTTYLIDRDARERADAETGLSDHEAPAIRQIRRDEAACLRLLQWLTRELKNHRRNPAPQGEPTPQPRPTARAHANPSPSPRPSPSPSSPPEIEPLPPALWSRPSGPASAVEMIDLAMVPAARPPGLD
ncbi:hypothetical protein BH23PLA1_BH23PLA1_34850 [soil metagenome]